MPAPIVIKISGHELDSPDFLAELAATLKHFDTPVVIVHGGGKEITALQTRLGIEPRYVDGLRITDAESLALVEMVLCGTVNKRIVRTLVNAGIDAVGLSGVDGGLVSADKMTHESVDMGYTGEVTAVRVDLLVDMLDQGITPVIAPICLGEDSNFNVNADHVAGAVAAALEAERLVFVSNVEGVLKDGAVIPQLTPNQVGEMIADGTIFGGMIPKVKTALESLAEGVAQAVITNLKGLSSGGGTVFAEKLD
ncbi:MAG: acetylglutamate kinase [Anaerolineae bacterium]|nr:acetylglutamate kinase [Anaerolineae bacterium]